MYIDIYGGRRKDRMLVLLSEAEKNKLVKLLEEKGLIAVESGHVDVKNPKRNHPVSSGDGIPIPLPVAFIGKTDYYLELVNTDKRALRKYQNQIRELLGY